MNVAAASGQPTFVIRPQSGKAETVLFVLAILVLVGSTVGYVQLHPRGDDRPRLTSWQISSFDGLGSVDQAIHSALLPAVEEIIWNNNSTGGWDSIEDLQRNMLPPFHQDVFWRANGELRWQAVMPGATDTKRAALTAQSVHQEPGAPPPPPNAVFKGTLGQGAMSYYGSGGKLPGQGAFLIVIGHAHSGVYWINQGTVWIHSNPRAPFPQLTKTEALIQEGWHQIVPYSGANEYTRLHGKS